MKIFIPHPYQDKEIVYHSGSGATLSGFNHIQALSRVCQVFLPAPEPQSFGPNLFGIRQSFETLDSSRQWFEQQGFDGILMFEPSVDDLAFFRHVCPAPVVIRLSCSFGNNRGFMDQALRCYSLLRPYDALSPKSEFGARELAGNVFDDSHLQPIPNGVDAEVFQPMEKPAAKQQLSEMASDARFLEWPVVGFCGRFEPAKGAYPFLRMADVNPEVLFAVVGRQFAPVIHPPNVVFLGGQSYDRMPLFYNALDVLCALTVYAYESCPSSVLEGMACGLPVVATRFAGAPELLGDCGRFIEITRFENEPLNVAGYIDPDALSNQVQGLLESESERFALGGLARKRALEFSWDRTAQKILDLFGRLKEKREQPACPVPLTVHFSLGCNAEGKLESIPRGFNYIGSRQGPLPRIPFLGQDMAFLEGLGVFLSQMMHPNEVEAAMLGLCGDRDTAHRALRKIRQFGDMLMAP